MNVKKTLRFSLKALSIILSLFLIFTIFSFIREIIYINSFGGLSALNYPDITGHLVIMLLTLGCLYVSIKTTLKLKGD